MIVVPSNSWMDSQIHADGDGLCIILECWRREIEVAEPTIIRRYYLCDVDQPRENSTSNFIQDLVNRMAKESEQVPIPKRYRAVRLFALQEGKSQHPWTGSNDFRRHGKPLNAFAVKHRERPPLAGRCSEAAPALEGEAARWSKNERGFPGAMRKRCC